MAGQSLIEILFKSKYDGSGTASASNDLKQISGSANIAETALMAAGGAIVALGAVRIGQTVVELAQMGAQAGRVETSFRQMQASVGQSADASLAALRKASRGAIADTELELAANRAKTLGVAQNTQQLTQLIEVASARGKALGLSTAEAFDNIVTGIGRMSPLILDNLGIMTGGAATFEAYAASIGKSADQLTDAERKQALFNKVIVDSRGIVEQSKQGNTDYATSFERLGASIQNAKEKLGKEFAPGVSAGAGFIADFLDTYTALVEKAEKSGNIDFYGNLPDQTAEATGNVLNLEGALNRSEGALDADAEASSRAAIHTKLFGDSAADAKSKVDALTASVLTLAGSLPGLQTHINDQMKDAARARDNAVSSLASKAAGTKTDDETRLKLYNEGLEKIDKRWADLNAQVREGKLTADEYALAVAQLGTGSADAFDQITASQKEAASEAKRWASSIENEVKKAYDHLQSTVAGVIQSAQNLSDIGVDPSKILLDPKEKDPKKQQFLLPREDEINENARRLADIAVNGFKDQDWLGKFKKEVPDIWKALEESGDPRATAARLLQRFQDGLEPELLDKEKAKERVRKLLLGEAKTNELVDEITQEMADELGTSAPDDIKSKVKEALTGKSDEKTKIELDTSGIGPAIQTAFAAPDISVAGGGGGDSAGKAFNDKALAAVNGTGVKIIDAVDGELRADANLAKLGQAGNIGGTKYGAEFLSGAINNIAQPFLDYVTKIVTGNVIANINTQNQLQGANP